MPTGKSHSNWAAYATVSMVVLLASVVVAVATELWVLTALPVGFLFGFFLQKGDLCGSSAFSEVVLMKDARKVWGLWVAIVVSMLGFALLSQLGWVTLNPKPMTWFSFMLGGIIFGAGTVLAGGCISGCLYKAGTGNLNSIFAIPGIFFGIALMEHGPLHGVNRYLKTYTVAAADGGSVTFSSVTGAPFWVLALALGLLTAILAAVLFRRRTSAATPATKGVANGPGRLKRVLTRPWKPWQAGIAIGLLGMAAYLSSAASGRNYPLGVTHGVLFTGVLATDHGLKHVYGESPSTPSAPPGAKGDWPAAQSGAASPRPPSAAGLRAATAQPKKVVWWLVGVVTCLVLGSWTAGRISGQAHLLPKPPEQTVIAFMGGILVGAGAALAKGCVIGNILSGIGLMSVGTVIFAAATVLTNWVTTYVYLMGGSPFRRA